MRLMLGWRWDGAKESPRSKQSRLGFRQRRFPRRAARRFPRMPIGKKSNRMSQPYFTQRTLSKRSDAYGTRRGSHTCFACRTASGFVHSSHDTDARVEVGAHVGGIFIARNVGL